MRLITATLTGLVLLAGCGDSGEPAPAKTPEVTGPTVSAEDLAVLEGTGWTGEHTYRGYVGAQEDVTIPSSMTVRESGGMYVLNFEYEDSLSNYSQELPISADGRQLGLGTITERTENGDVLTIVTEEECLDAQVDSICRFTFEISPNYFTERRHVTALGDDLSIQRDYFRYTR
ncbi:MAG: hypothetical protein WA989_10555 [Henriciella sp.]|uniref:hypothetical protein n=1 Tax=Henriciella sp. TaxID=1968823 RepID=UPI003C70B44F